MRTTRPAVLAVSVLTAATLAACSVSSGPDDSDEPDAAETAGTPGKVVLATHDSWAMPKKLVRAFEEDTGLELEIVPSGDAGGLTNKLVLTKDAPIADAVYGIDNTFASRALDADVLEEDVVTDPPASASSYELPGDDRRALAPVDWADVCVNVDLTWFDKEGIDPPESLEDLTKPAYRDLVSTPSAATSSPGFAFLLSTIARFGEDGWQDYWTDLVGNGARIAGSWTDAYEGDFTASGQGDRPVVLSYNTSPPFTIPEGASQPTTAALLDTCFRQVEYAAVLKGSDNPEGGREVVAWLQSRAVQEAIPDNMYVFPVDDEAVLPTLWEQYAEPAPEPFAVAPDAITENRDDWIREWTDVTSR